MSLTDDELTTRLRALAERFMEDLVPEDKFFWKVGLGLRQACNEIDDLKRRLAEAEAQRDLFQIALTGQATRTRTFRAQVALSDALTQLFETAHSRNILKEYDPPVLARFITGMITQGIFWWFEHDEPGPEAMSTQVLLLLQHGLPEQLFT